MVRVFALEATIQEHSDDGVVVDGGKVSGIEVVDREILL
jgi:hypothetical protein